YNFTPLPPTDFYTLSLHDALPISIGRKTRRRVACCAIRQLRLGAGGEVIQKKMRQTIAVRNVDDAAAVGRPVELRLGGGAAGDRSEEHTSELQSRGHLVCRLLLEK